MNAFREHLIATEESPRAFAARSGMGKTQVYNLYNGTFRRCPWISTLRRVSELTGIPFVRLYADFIVPYERKKEREV
jgi:hypothetical protein